VGEIAAKAVVQLLFATGKSFTVDGLREKLREFFRQEVRPELRAVAALNNVELQTRARCETAGSQACGGIRGGRRPVALCDHRDLFTALWPRKLGELTATSLASNQPATEPLI
jgi:hypothetical protein